MVRKISVLLLCLAMMPAALFAQSQSNANPADAQLLAEVNHTIANEQAFKGMTIIPSVSNGVVTLSGTVSNYAAKVLASNEIGNISGVRTVLNNLTINSSYTAPPANTEQDQQAQPEAQSQPYGQTPQQNSSQEEQNAGPNPQLQPSQNEAQQQPSQAEQNSEPMQPAEPALQPGQNAEQAPAAQPYSGPSVTSTRTLVLPSGTLLPIRLSDEINTATAQPNQVFHGELVHAVRYDGYVVIPRGTIFVGRVISAQAAGRFAGYAQLSIELTSFTINGPDGPQRVSVITEPISSEGEKGRGKNTAEKAGGVALFGAIVGALAGGGKGAAVGALAGGAVGAGLNAKRGQEIDLKPEQLLQFTTSDTTVVTIYLHNGEQITASPLTTPVLLPAQQQPQQPQY